MLVFGNATFQIAKQGCYTCGRGDSLVSTEIICEGEGILAFCPGCIHDMAVTAGYKLNAVADFDALQESLAVFHALGEIAAAQRDEAEAKLATLRETWVAAVEAHEAAQVPA